MEEWFARAEWFDNMRARPDECRAEAHRRIILEFVGRPLLSNTPSTTFSLVDRIGDIRCPILAYNGSEDLDEFKQVAMWLSKNLPTVEQVELPGLGGFPAWESPATVNALVEGFLNALSY